MLSFINDVINIKLKIINKNEKIYYIKTGGAGFVGSNLIKGLLKKETNKNLISIDNYSSGSKKNHVSSKRN